MVAIPLVHMYNIQRGGSVLQTIQIFFHVKELEIRYILCSISLLPVKKSKALEIRLYTLVHALQHLTRLGQMIQIQLMDSMELNV